MDSEKINITPINIDSYNNSIDQCKKSFIHTLFTKTDFILYNFIRISKNEPLDFNYLGKNIKKQRKKNEESFINNFFPIIATSIGYYTDENIEKKFKVNGNDYVIFLNEFFKKMTSFNQENKEKILEGLENIVMKEPSIFFFFFLIVYHYYDDVRKIIDEITTNENLHQKMQAVKDVLKKMLDEEKMLDNTSPENFLALVYHIVVNCSMAYITESSSVNESIDI